LIDGFGMTRETLPPITIGIPTYNRSGPLSRLLTQIGGLDFSRFDLRVLVVDDGSHEDAYQQVEAVARAVLPAGAFTLLRHPGNLGYARTFMRLFEECRTDYLMPLADDDVIIEQGIETALAFLASTPAQLLAPHWMDGSRIYRGVRQTRPIEASEFFDCSNHAPGLVYAVSAAKPHLGKLQARLGQGCAFTMTYPQTVLTLHLMFAGCSCYWLNAATAGRGEELESGIKDAAGDGYWTYTSRLRQAVCLEELFDQIEPSDARQAALTAVRHRYLHWIYWSNSDSVRRMFGRSVSLKARLMASAGRFVPTRAKRVVRRLLSVLA